MACFDYYAVCSYKKPSCVFSREVLRGVLRPLDAPFAGIARAPEKRATARKIGELKLH
jgi:hypothetical protein